MIRRNKRGVVIGAGPNGLSAAIALAQAGLPVDLYEAESTPGGAARTMELTLPGFHHDFGSAVHPMAASSPFFKSLQLEQHGLEWIYGDAPLAHPLDDGTAVILERDLKDAARAFGEDGASWRAMVEPFVENWRLFLDGALQPPTRIPRHPLLMGRFASMAFQSARSLASRRFENGRTQALFAGLAAHSFLALDQRLSSAFGIVLGASAHAAGWPIPRGGAQAIADALVSKFQELGGTLHLNVRIRSFDEFSLKDSAIFCDLTPRQLEAIGRERLTANDRKRFSRFRYGPGAFKIDYALSQPIPWRAKECGRAITVHVGGSMEEIAHAEREVSQGRVADAPFLLVAQPSLFDATRAPVGKHVAWVYCHIPNGCTVDMTSRIEAQLERFAPGFRDCVLARRVLNPSSLESMNANLIDGDISGGEMSMRQFFFRPSWRGYATATPNLYLCSSSTPPGGGVHGMCGFNAVQSALRRLR